jgi:translation initiation factor IF-3
LRDEVSNRINHRITAKEVRVTGENVTVGVYSIEAALQMAASQGLDLVEIAPGASPPVCRIVDFSKFKYEQKKKNKELKAKAIKVVIKEIRFGPNTSEHDFDFKVKHAKSFLAEGAKIKAYVHFVGRSIVFSDRGRDLLARFTAALTEDGKVEMEPKLEGKRMFLIMAPKPKK